MSRNLLRSISNVLFYKLPEDADYECVDYTAHSVKQVMKRAAWCGIWTTVGVFGLCLLCWIF